MSLGLWLVGAALAGPFRGPLVKPATVEEGPGRDPRVLYVKLREGTTLEGWAGSGGSGLSAALAGRAGMFRARRLFADAPAGLAPAGVELAGWIRVEGEGVASLGRALLADRRVETAYLAPLPAPPPGPPWGAGPAWGAGWSAGAAPPPAGATPDFRPEQTWLDPLPGLGFTEAALHDGAPGELVTVADVEYGWESDHEDFAGVPAAAAWGQDRQLYAFHGTSVLGQLVGVDNGFGVVGAVPEAAVLPLSPYDPDGSYSVAEAVFAAASLLSAGDVLLIEQQAYCPWGSSYCPVEVDDATFDAIAAVVAMGIVVVEPGGNGGEDLDDPVFGGIFDRSLRDSGAILVGGGASPYSGWPERSWYPNGSSFGARVDVQGWFDSIVTTTNGDYGGAYADLYFPGDDPRRAYTESFGGTSGASPMIAAAAAVVQSAAMARGGAPWDPYEVRAALVATGTPEPADSPFHIGPQPDLRRLLRTWFR